MLSVICPHQRTVTVLFAQNMKPVLLRKMVSSGMNILVSPHDTAHELLSALTKAIASLMQNLIYHRRLKNFCNIHRMN